MRRAVSGSALVFRGPGDESDRVAKALTAAGVEFELVEMLVPAILGASIIVCEVGVAEADWAAANRAIAQIAGKGKFP